MCIHDNHIGWLHLPEALKSDSIQAFPCEIAGGNHPPGPDIIPQEIHPEAHIITLLALPTAARRHWEIPAEMVPGFALIP
jgi:hypothetical protein